jgi:hypothetical protein
MPILSKISNDLQRLNKINQNPVSPSDMKKFLEALELEADKSFEHSVFIATQLFPDNEGLRFSINMRFAALTKIIKNEMLPGWVKSTDSSSVVDVAENLYMAAGLEPMVEIENDLGFNLDALLQKAFKLGNISA